MFTGIIEAEGLVTTMVKQGSNMVYNIDSVMAPELKIDQSVAHDGVCLTVTQVSGNSYSVTAVQETLQKTNLGQWRLGRTINLERAMLAGGRLDGHFVQGHVDCTATCIEKTTLDGSWIFRLSFPAQHAALLIEKGSVCINGVSLTVFEVTINTFAVTIIPYTYTHTNFDELEEGSIVNIEFDVLGKYINRMQEVGSQNNPTNYSVTGNMTISAV